MWISKYMLSEGMVASVDFLIVNLFPKEKFLKLWIKARFMLERAVSHTAHSNINLA
jgi:hypothetical protein